jgi:hypothetical protein
VKKLIIITSTLLGMMPAFAQSTLKTLTYSVDATIGSGVVAPSVAATKYFSLKKAKQTKFSLGLGARFTQVIGSSSLEYNTAPAILTSGKKGPAVFFANQIPSNIDTFVYSKTSVSALNLMLAFNYNISRKIAIEFNIDAVGFSFGKEQLGTLQNPAFIGANTAKAKPTAINALLVSDNDLGTLNSQMILKYRINKNFQAKVGAGFLFTEYTNNVNNIVNNPLALNDRFRNKNLGIILGIGYSFNKNPKTSVIKKDI